MIRETEGSSVGKAQKSLLINEDLVRLLDLMQKRTGASFTRQVTASVLQYLFDRPEGPDPYWMELAVGLDDGTLDLDGIIGERESAAEAEADLTSGLQVEPHPQKPGASIENACAHFVERAENVVKGWAAMREPKKTAAILRIIQAWKDHSSPKTD